MTTANLGQPVLVRIHDDAADVFGVTLRGTLTAYQGGLARVSFHGGESIGVPAELVTLV
jgi:hypothetical protein